MANSRRAAHRLTNYRATTYPGGGEHQAHKPPEPRPEPPPQPRPQYPALPPGAIRTQPKRPKSRAARRRGH